MFHRAGNRDDKPEFANKNLTVVPQLSSFATSKKMKVSQSLGTSYGMQKYVNKICLPLSLYSSQFDG